VHINGAASDLAFLIRRRHNGPEMGVSFIRAAVVVWIEAAKPITR
jgi:hypothetical protein